jgi:protein subunit release factor B
VPFTTFHSQLENHFQICHNPDGKILDQKKKKKRKEERNERQKERKKVYLIIIT